MIIPKNKFRTNSIVVLFRVFLKSKVKEKNMKLDVLRSAFIQLWGWNLNVTDGHKLNNNFNPQIDGKLPRGPLHQKCFLWLQVSSILIDWKKKGK